MILARNLFALVAGCCVAAVLLNMMEPNVVESAERFLRGHPEELQQQQDRVLQMTSTNDEEALIAKLALAEFLIHPSGKVNDAEEH